MNIHHNIKAVSQKYKDNKVATEAIQEVSKIYSESIQGIIKMLSKPKRTVYEQLLSYSELLTVTFKKIVNNPSTTKEELAEARNIFKLRITDLEKIMEAL